MSALPLEAQTHIEILSELLRDVNLEKRMETLIQVEDMLKRKDLGGKRLQLIRNDLEEEMLRVRKMIFMVDRAEGSMDQGQS